MPYEVVIEVVQQGAVELVSRPCAVSKMKPLKHVLTHSIEELAVVELMIVGLATGKLFAVSQKPAIAGSFAGCK